MLGASFSFTQGQFMPTIKYTDKEVKKVLAIASADPEHFLALARVFGGKDTYDKAKRSMIAWGILRSEDEGHPGNRFTRSR